jgi:hypothetical protein
MAVSIDEISAEIAPANDGAPSRGRGAGEPAPSAETIIRKHREISEQLNCRSERVRAD